MGKKKKEQVKVESIGNSTTNVCGSCFSITYPTKQGDKKILVELGMYQGGRTVLEDYNMNQRLIDSINYKDYSALIILHGHA